MSQISCWTLGGVGEGATQGLNKRIGEEEIVFETAAGIIQSQGINRLHFETADSARLHQPHLALQFVRADRRPKPPPARHDLAVFRRVDERLPQTGEIAGLIRLHRPSRRSVG